MCDFRKEYYAGVAVKDEGDEHERGINESKGGTDPPICDHEMERESEDGKEGEDEGECQKFVE